MKKGGRKSLTSRGYQLPDICINFDIANKKNKKKIIHIFVSVQVTNHPPNVNKTSAKAGHTEREVFTQRWLSKEMTVELLCWRGYLPSPPANYRAGSLTAL